MSKPCMRFSSSSSEHLERSGYSLLFGHRDSFPNWLRRFNLPASRLSLSIKNQLKMFVRKTELFETELRPNTDVFRQGDPIVFVARFKGKLDNGYFGTYIKTPNGFSGCFDPSTVSDKWRQKGNMNGPKNVENIWHWMIPVDAQTGNWGFYIHAASYYPESSWLIRQYVKWLHWRHRRRTDLARGQNKVVAGDWHYVKLIER